MSRRRYLWKEHIEGMICQGINDIDSRNPTFNQPVMQLPCGGYRRDDIHIALDEQRGWTTWMNMRNWGGQGIDLRDFV